MLKKRNKAMISLLLSFTIFLSYMLPLLNGLPDLLPSVTIHAADDTSGITQYGNVKRYDSIDLFEKDYPDDAEQFRKEFNTIDGEKTTAYKGFSYDNFKVVVSLFESGENFAMLYDANRYPDVEGEFDLSDFSAFATHYCKYLNTLKELTGVSHGVLNVFLHTESGLSPGWWSSTLNVNTNRDYTDGVLTGIKNCTKSDFYSNWCLLHETSHSYSESYFNVHSETSVNLRSFAALHAMDYLNYDGFHLMVDKLGGFDNESEPLKTSKIFTDAEIGDTPKDYTTERYMDTFHDTIVYGLKTTYFYYDSLDDVNAKVIYGNCSTLDAAILSACTQTNLLQYFDADDPDYMVETEEYEKIFKNALNGSDSKIDWDQFYAQFIVNADNINENSFMKGALEVYHNYVDDAKNQINVESGNVMYVTDTVKNFLDSNYKSNNGIYPVSHLFVRFYENLELISGDITFPSGVQEVRSKDFTFSKFLERLLDDSNLKVPSKTPSTLKIIFHRNLSSSDAATATEIFNHGVKNQRIGYKPDGTARYSTMNSADIGFGNWKRDGYKMCGWNDDPIKSWRLFDTYSDIHDEVIVSDSPILHLYAVWKANTYTVTFNANGGACSTATKSVTYNSTYGTLPTPTRTGYTFAGWYTAASGGTKVTAGSTYNTVGNVTLYAHWTVKTYTVTFDGNGGACSTATKSVTYNSTYGTMPTPTRTGYTFAGWYTAASGGTKITEESKYTAAGGTTLYAHWNAKTIKVILHRNLKSNDTVVATEYFTCGVENQRFGYKTDGTPRYSTMNPENIGFGNWKRDGYTMLGWNLDAAATAPSCTTYTSVVDSFIAGYEPEVNMYAVWKANNYTVTFNANGGTCSTASKSVTYNSTYGTLPTPTRTGYTFAGWYTAASGGTKITEESKYTTAGNVTLYAHWTVKTYTVTFNANGGACSTATKSVTYNSTYGTLPTPTRTGYTFAGWYTAASGGTKITEESKYTTAGNSTLYAHWTAESVKVRLHRNLKSDDTLIATETFTYGVKNQRIGYKPDGTARYSTMNPDDIGFGNWERTGYTMLGWSDDPAATSALCDTYGDISNEFILENTPSLYLYAVWEAKTYTVTFDANGGTCSTKSKSVTFNRAYNALPTPTRTGYTFAGWYTAASGGKKVTAGSTFNTDSNVTLYAHWQKNEVAGDVNADGTFNIADVVMLQKWLLGVPDVMLADWKAADMCADERLDVFDLCLMKREILKATE